MTLLAMPATPAHCGASLAAYVRWVPRRERRASPTAAGAVACCGSPRDVVARLFLTDGHDQVGTVVDRGQQAAPDSTRTRRAGEYAIISRQRLPTGPEGLAAPSPFFEPVHHAFRIGVVLVDGQ